MEKNFLKEKRAREKEESPDEIEKDILGQESLNIKKPKLEEIKTDNQKINSPQINEIKAQNDINNLENKDIGELAFNYNSININIKCKICQKDITNNIKFYCNVCPDFIYCIKCFISSKHPKSHEYHIIDNLNFPFYTDDWTVNDEHKLISNISKCGLNNWEEVSKSMNNKGQLECESHYYSFYNINKDNPNPDESKIIIDENKKINEKQLLINKQINNEMIKNFSSNPGNSTFETEKESQNIKRNSRSLCVRKNSKGGGAESVSEILGVHPKRKEFDNEFLNDAEIELSHLEFNDKENEKDYNIKMELLKDYNLILKEREKRKNFIFEKGMLDLRRQNRIESKLTKEEYDLLLFMRPFHRFYENSEFYDQLEGIFMEQQLKSMLKTLNRLENEKNSKGGKISTIEDIEKFFENDKNANKGRKHNTHEHNKEKDKDKEKDSNIYEENFIGNRLLRFYEFDKISQEKKMEEIFDEDEFKLVKEMPIPRSTFYDIKIKIKEIVTNFKEKKNEKNENLKEMIEKLIERYGLERQTHMEIFEFYCKKYNDLIVINQNEIKKEKGNKKVNKDTSISYIDDGDEIQSESNKSNKNRYKNKKNRGKRKNKIKEVIKINNDTDNENEKEKEKEKEKKEKEKEKEKPVVETIKLDNENDNNKMDIEIESSKENKINVKEKKEKEKEKDNEKEKEIKEKENVNNIKEKEKEIQKESSIIEKKIEEKKVIENNININTDIKKDNKEKEDEDVKMKDIEEIKNEDKINEKEDKNDKSDNNNNINNANAENQNDNEGGGEEQNKKTIIEKTDIKYYK